MTHDSTPLPERLIVIKRLWNGKSFTEVGTRYTVTDETVARDLIAKRFIADADDVERERNPEAFSAREQAERAQDTIKQLQQELQEAKSNAEFFEEKSRKFKGVDLDGLQRERDAIRSELDAAQARVRDLESVVETVTRAAEDLRVERDAALSAAQQASQASGSGAPALPSREVLLERFIAIKGVGKQLAPELVDAVLGPVTPEA